MFDLKEVEVQDGFAPIPNGSYSSFVDKVEFKTSKKGQEYLSLGFKIFGAEYENRVVFSIYNINHPTEQAKNIALADIKKMLLATGLTEDKMNFQSKEALAEAVSAVRCNIVLRTRTQEGYNPSNEIKGYAPLENEAPEQSFTKDQIPF